MPYDANRRIDYNGQRMKVINQTTVDIAIGDIALYGITASWGRCNRYDLLSGLTTDTSENQDFFFDVADLVDEDDAFVIPDSGMIIFDRTTNKLYEVVTQGTMNTYFEYVTPTQKRIRIRTIEKSGLDISIPTTTTSTTTTTTTTTEAP